MIAAFIALGVLVWVALGALGTVIMARTDRHPDPPILSVGMAFGPIVLCVLAFCYVDEKRRKMDAWYKAKYLAQHGAPPPPSELDVLKRKHGRLLFAVQTALENHFDDDAVSVLASVYQENAR